MSSEVTQNRLYKIQNHGEDFFTGVCADGRQAVMGLLCPNVVAYFFDAKGHFLGSERQLWIHPAPRMSMPPELAHIPTIMEPGTGPYQIYDRQFVAAIKTQIEQWQKALGWTTSTIEVLEFFDATHSVGIRRMPGYLDSKSRDPEIKRLRQEWLSQGQFVWWWSKDYEMDPDDEEEST
jgi:hypothetical protein